MTASEQHLIWFLRVSAVMFLSAFGAVVMPTGWMDTIHEWQGLGKLPDVPLMGYLARTLSAVYAAMGANYWFLSRDVPRYLPLLRFTVPLTLVLDLTILAIDVAVAMPLSWTIPEGVCIFGWTLALGWLVQRVRARPLL